jgi:4-hydroxybenzoate polyprenyltransferase
MSRPHAYARLARLPALPTALADIGLGALATGALPGHWFSCTLVALASACLYTGGMVCNDYFDVEQDRRERPERPIPSGAVSRREAGFLGAGLLAGGVFLALLAGAALALSGAARPWLAAMVAVVLAGAILLYDGVLKRTWAGPVGMGACRFLNVLLGVSAAGSAPGVQGVHLALVVGLYIGGVTWFARTEARQSRQSSLAGAAAVMLAALVLALPLPALREPGQTTSALFPYLLVGLGFFVGLPVSRAIRNSTPGRVQPAVGSALRGLIILDAALASALAGWAGLLLLLLLVPSIYLARRRGLYAT